MSRRFALLLVLMLVAACGGDPAPTTGTSATEPAVTTTATAATTSTTAPPTTATTTSATDATTTSTSTTTTTTAPSSDGLLDDGRPATFVAITDDYAAVEVDTLTGDIIHVFGQTGTAAEVAAAEEMPPNVLTGVWRLRDGSVVGISDCCEPAAGNIFYVASGEELGSDPYLKSGVHGWTLTPSPTAEVFANLGYAIDVTDPTVTADTGPGVWINEPGLGFPLGAAAFTLDGSELYWTTLIEEAAALATLDLAEGAPQHAGLLPWVGVHQSLDGLGTQASGNLVGFLHTRDESNEVISTEGVVFTTAGEVLATFPVEMGSVWGGYDPSGTFLIYVDGDGIVRWQGGGATGAIAKGFYFASW